MLQKAKRCSARITKDHFTGLIGWLFVTCMGAVFVWDPPSPKDGFHPAIAVGIIWLVCTVMLIEYVYTMWNVEDKEKADKDREEAERIRYQTELEQGAARENRAPNTSSSSSD